MAGGWLSGHLLRRGRSVNFARKTALLVCALCMPLGILAVFSASPWMALVFISIGTAAHQGWSANFYPASDMFPKKDVGSVVGIGGAAGAFGGAILAWVAGHILQHHTYLPLFIIAGSHASAGHARRAIAGPENRENPHAGGRGVTLR